MVLLSEKRLGLDLAFLEKVAAMMKERVHFIPEILESGYYLFEPVKSYDNKTILKRWKPENMEKMIILAETLKNNGFKIYSDGTDTHLMLVDLRPYKVKGNLAAESLSKANITCNKNGIPFDSEKPMITSGIRLGTQAATTRGFGLNEFKTVGELITKVVKGLSDNPEDNSKIEEEVRNEVIELTSHFPIYKNLK